MILYDCLPLHLPECPQRECSTVDKLTKEIIRSHGSSSSPSWSALSGGLLPSSSAGAATYFIDNRFLHGNPPSPKIIRGPLLLKLCFSFIEERCCPSPNPSKTNSLQKP